VATVLKKIESQTDFRFVYSSTRIDIRRNVTLNLHDQSVAFILQEVFKNQTVVFYQKGSSVILSPQPVLNPPSKIPENPIKKSEKIAFGAVKGKITDALSGEPLPGANIVVQGTLKGSSTDLLGAYQINLVPEGTQTLLVSYLGYENTEQTIQVVANQILTVDFQLKNNATELGEVVITSLSEGQEKALNQQRTADNIKNIVSADLIGRFPDLNVAEALMRIPGINIERDRGEGGEVQLRGAPPSFTTVNINGEQIPGTQDEGQRNEELSLIPVDQLSSIEVTKAITPDQDGDNIGGTIDLKTPTAKSTKARAKIELGGGYNNIVEKLNFIGKASYNQRFFVSDQAQDGRLGIYLGGSYFSTNNGRDRTQYRYPAQYSELENKKSSVIYPARLLPAPGSGKSANPYRRLSHPGLSV
ncbi:MAG: TonB-dependent receptor plug domain-containing protein, partial [Bacteroidia bacterium]|nr:TonB-dependent receptor plug domain-containing protein [Bacteroidia bacterium]